MSKNEIRQMRLGVLILLAILGVCMPFTVDTTVVSWWMVLLDFVLLGVVFAAVGFVAFHVGLGHFGNEFVLDTNLCYRIDQVVKLGDGQTLLILMEGKKHSTRQVIIPHQGFKNFEILDDKYVVPKGKGAKVMDGRLVLPVHY